MGQVILRGPDYETTARALERLIPMNVLDLGVDRQRYGFFTNDQGGILDDLMFANRGDHIFVGECRVQRCRHCASTKTSGT